MNPETDTVFVITDISIYPHLKGASAKCKLLGNIIRAYKNTLSPSKENRATIRDIVDYMRIHQEICAISTIIDFYVEVLRVADGISTINIPSIRSVIDEEYSMSDVILMVNDIKNNTKKNNILNRLWEVCAKQLRKYSVWNHISVHALSRGQLMASIFAHLSVDTISEVISKLDIISLEDIMEIPFMKHY